ncbi:MAG TPA: 7TM diverse intracellular signaling domain-containing protein [Pedobacter sp.]|nr:7TM diverse intracellular signaling domain-containing protein [Pedobacter sp.]
MNESFYHILFLSACTFQLVFMLLQWVLFRRPDYLYYILYVFACGLFIALRVNNVIQILPFTLNPSWNEITDHPLIVFAIWMYIRFGYHFLNLKQLQPKVYIAAKRLEYGFAGYFFIKFLLLPLNLSYYYASLIYLVVVLILVTLAGFVIIRLLKQKNLLNNFLVSGSLCITIGGGVGPVLALFLPNMGEGSLLIYYPFEIALLIEFFLLTTGFALKNKILQQQVIKAQQEIIKGYQNRSD